MPVVNLAILIMVALVLVIALLAWFIGTRRSRVKMDQQIRAQIADARIDAGEHESSLVAEQIEEIVRKSLAAYPDLSGIKLDFGTVADGTLDIWVGDHQYSDAEDVPDLRIRDAIREAVAKFNR